MAEHIFTDQSFSEDVLKSATPVLVDFWAEWCGPCKMLSPLVEELAHEYEGRGIKIGKLNVDENPETATNYGVMSIPTLIFFKGGKPVEQIVGVQPREELKKKIEEVLAL